VTCSLKGKRKAIRHCFAFLAQQCSASALKGKTYKDNEDG